MATGPEHYRQAEQLAKAANDHHAGGDPESAGVLLQLAQVHAALALAAATATASWMDEPSAGEWGVEA